MLFCQSTLISSVCLLLRFLPAPRSSLFPYTTLFRSETGDLERPAVVTHSRDWPSDDHYADDPAVERRSDGELMTDNGRSEEHTSELQSLRHLVCRLLLEKKKEGLLRHT